MNRGLKNELSLVAGLGSAFFALRRKNRLALGLSLLSAGLKLATTKPYTFYRRTVMITGGSRGLGLALAQDLISQRANVVLLARDEDELTRAIEILRKIPGGEALGLVCDITSKNQLRQAFEKTVQKFRGLDVLINNAGSVSAGPAESMTMGDYEAQMKIHFFASMEATYMAIPLFKTQGEGRIVNISSIGGKIPIPHMVPYCASKFALSGFSQSISTELKKDNIIVSTVYPGLMRTGSPIQAVFKGDHQKEFAWFATMDSLPGISVSAKYAATQILTAVGEGRTEIIISPSARAAAFVHGVFPEIYNAVFGWVNKILPKGVSCERKTGAQSQEWLKKRIWSKPLMNHLEKNQQDYNEHEKTDAEFNLNISTPNPKLIH